MENSLQSRSRHKGGGGGASEKFLSGNVMFSSSVYTPIDCSVNNVSFI